MADEFAIESSLKEKRLFKPDPKSARAANVPGKAAYDRLVAEAERNPERYWARLAKQHVHWFTPWKKVLDWKPPFAKWFIGAKTNVSYNCIDRHLEGENAWRRNKAAIIWEGEPGDERVLTYGDLHREVCKFANVLKTLGVKKGDRVALYMPLVPELAIAMLACTRIGAPHSIIFSTIRWERSVLSSGPSSSIAWSSSTMRSQATRLTVMSASLPSSSKMNAPRVKVTGRSLPSPP